MITIQTPNRILYMQAHNLKLFLLSLFFLSGTTLFSCADKSDRKKKSEQIEVADSEKKQNDNPKQISSLPEKENQSEHAEKNIEIKNEEIVSSKNNSEHSVSASTDLVKSIKTENTNNTEKDKKNTSSKKAAAVKTEVPLHKNAELPGGIDQFYTFFEKEYKKPENTTKLNIKISFAVEKNGSVSYIESEPAVDKIVETEIIRVISLSPKWQPGESNGKKIKMQYSLPIVLK
ncbi:hypothetical protein [Flavobacterium pectinovorum]|uniref:hypothetical protein n=1 Tax=Flavobacterium pectinovorum TaxID=29533 RepID=UPI001FADF0FB|nr:hypothetical protein [Flavobacterium pectinovorum]MCI9846620.1 hypothetical protein [Flavobacterium pectinovorum]